ncbi:MAG: ATPase [Ignavibacteriales bacterium CG18_big_fil_WC_8_21_14_2_50_31_20]|nr:MAG: ATPase [Ignavibacteriales bacterium CG18_big_fil_WC_8_21_14_2_50_31_20]
MENLQRKFYLDKVEPFIGKNLIKVLVGQRRVGKSYLLLQLIDLIKEKDLNANCVFVDKEKYQFDEIKNYSNLIEYIEQKMEIDRTNYVFIDEIQDIEGFEKALRHFYSYDNFDIYCTGSNANLLSGELASYLSGRYIEIKVFGLSWNEFLLFHKLPNDKSSLEKYLIFGGLPFIKNLPLKEEIVFDYLKNIYSTIIYKDIISRFNIRNTNFLENLVKFAANNVGNILSAKKISDYLKSQKTNISPQVVLTYLDYLCQAFLIYKVNRSDIVGKKVFEVGEKYYFEDWGIKNSIIGYQQTHINQLLENIVFIHLKTNNYVVFVGKLGSKEIDFICEKDGTIVYIQCAYLITDDNVREREFGNLLEIKDNYRKIVVSLDNFTLGNYKGIEHLHLFDFLNTFN